MSETSWDYSEIIPIREKVFEYIKNSILNGELKAGERIVERELAEKLNISRTPIREALFRLESLGFVKTLPRKGVVVSIMTIDEVIEIFTILANLEGLAVKLAAQKLEPAHEEKLAELRNQIIESLEREGQEKLLARLHLEMIDTLLIAAKSPRLHEMLNGLFEYIRAFAYVSHDNLEHRKSAFKEHIDIAEAVLNRDSELAESLVKIHIENSKKAYLELEKKWG